MYQNIHSLSDSGRHQWFTDDSDMFLSPPPPLPPPPPPQASLNQLRQQLADLKFPRPPSEIESPTGDLDCKQKMWCSRQDENSHYTNLMATPESIYHQSIEHRKATLAADPSHAAETGFSAKPQLRQVLSPGISNLSSHSSVSSTNRAQLGSKQLNQSSPTAIYANLNSDGSQLATLGYKPYSAPIKNCLRVNRSSASKEEEVNHLTDLLVKSMENSAEPDFFGMCNKCGEKVVGEGSGCTAMEMVYHIQCFTCHDCQKELRGKSFYAMESNPFCEECYLNTLEKCCVCEKPILDRILRATGKPYHPSCFTCVVCKKSLDGIPFTVDASNQVHCIEDFHKKFAPRCSVCNDPIVPEPGKTETVRVVALDRSFHVSCYKCEDCDLLLSSEAEGRGCYPLDDHILCRNCNAKRVQAITAN